MTRTQTDKDQTDAQLRAEGVTTNDDGSMLLRRLPDQSDAEWEYIRREMATWWGGFVAELIAERKRASAKGAQVPCANWCSNGAGCGGECCTDYIDHRIRPASASDAIVSLTVFRNLEPGGTRSHTIDVEAGELPDPGRATLTIGEAHDLRKQLDDCLALVDADQGAS